MKYRMKIKRLSHLSSLRIHPLITVAATIVLTIMDLGTKHFFYNHGWAAFSWVQPAFNHGISYSIWLNMALIILVSVICLLWVMRMYIKHHIHSLIFILIMSWWIGNLIDRVVYGWVRDFIYLGDKIPVFNFVFNIADICLILWWILLIYHYNQVDITKQDPDSTKHLL